MGGWQFKNEVIVGDIGERIVQNILENDGYVLYTPLDPELAHAFDMLAIRDKDKMMAVEVKTKTRREEYPDSGVNIKSYRVYKEISKRYNLPIFICFVDYYLGEIYGNYLDVLDKNTTVYPDGRELDYPRFEGGIIYFPLESMIHIDYLTNEEIEKILKFTC